VFPCGHRLLFFRGFLCCLLLDSLASWVKIGEWFWALIRFLSCVDTGARHFWFHLRQGLTFVSFSLFSYLLFYFFSSFCCAVYSFCSMSQVFWRLLDTNYLILWQSAFLRQLYIFSCNYCLPATNCFFFVNWCPLDSNLPFLCFQLVSSTLIVYFLIGVLPPPIVISLLSYGLATFDSNLSLSAFF